MKKDHRESTVGPWAAEKLNALETYLDFYNTALKNQPFERVYIDAFAGSLRSKVRGSDLPPEPSPFFDEEEALEARAEFIIGSPVRALGLDPGFHRHHFFDLDESRVDKLRELCVGRNDVTIEVGDCNPMIRDLCQQLSDRNVRGVAFLDPYGAHVEWETLEALARTGTMEVIINFPVAMAINRMITRSGIVPENWSDQLTRCFGTDEWHEVAYRVERDLFGEEVVQKHGDVPDRLLDLYLARLRVIFSHVSSPRLIRNTRGVPLYYLVWAGPNKLGLKGAEYILRQGEKVLKTG
jgi:three-Cys-motif partner protein